MGYLYLFTSKVREGKGEGKEGGGNASHLRGWIKDVEEYSGLVRMTMLTSQHDRP